MGTRFHIHVAEQRSEVDAVLSEHGCLPVELLHRLGVLDRSMVAVHLCWLEDREIELFGEARANLAYCPSSNMFLADGVTRIRDLAAAGVTIGLGTDGACSNNRSSIFEEMRQSALLQKVITLDAASITSHQALTMGTRNGGRVLDLPVGEISPGYRADFVGIRLDDLSMQPGPAPESAILPNLAYGMQPWAVDRVVVHGRQIASRGQIQSVPEQDIVKQVERAVASWPAPAM
jgi:5-methylthioadenosine/S-adenosylhomocysteine deaminase